MGKSSGRPSRPGRRVAIVKGLRTPFTKMGTELSLGSPFV